MSTALETAPEARTSIGDQVQETDSRRRPERPERQAGIGANAADGEYERTRGKGTSEQQQDRGHTRDRSLLRPITQLERPGAEFHHPEQPNCDEGGSPVPRTPARE